MSFRGLILSVPTAFPTTNGKGHEHHDLPYDSEATAGNWISMLVLGRGAAAAVWFNRLCARDAVVRADPTDLQVTADSLKAAVREAQRTAAELRTELDEQRKELADAQVAGAQLQGCCGRPSGAWRMPGRSSTCNVRSLSAARTEGTCGPGCSAASPPDTTVDEGGVVSRKESLVDTRGHRRDLESLRRSIRLRWTKLRPRLQTFLSEAEADNRGPCRAINRALNSNGRTAREDDRRP